MLLDGGHDAVLLIQQIPQFWVPCGDIIHSCRVGLCIEGLTLLLPPQV